VHWLTGVELTESVWDTFFDFYMETGSRKWGRPTSRARSIRWWARTMRERILLVMAKAQRPLHRRAINFIGSDTLFGRHWGAIEHHPFLHFELCYYQAIDYAIQHKLARVEAGARASTRFRVLHAGDDLLRPLHRRSGAATADRRLPHARAHPHRARWRNSRRWRRFPQVLDGGSFLFPPPRGEGLGVGAATSMT